MRTGCEPDGKSWQVFHTIYAHIEERGLEKIPVADKFNRSGLAISCLTLYVKTLLLHRARLSGMRRNQWQIVDRWLEYWGDTFSVEPTCSMTREDAPPLAVDLAGVRGLISIQRATSDPGMRFLALVPLSKLIRVKTILLQQGQSPQQNELGDDIDSTDSIHLLNKLHACWCEQRTESLVDEPRDVPVAKMCFGLESIYAHISRKPFKKPNIPGLSDKDAQKQIETFGRVLDQTDHHNLLEIGFLSEDWLVEDDGLLQARLLRKLGTGERVGMNQIVCVHTGGCKNLQSGRYHIKQRDAQRTALRRGALSAGRPARQLLPVATPAATCFRALPRHWCCRRYPNSRFLRALCFRATGSRPDATLILP